MKKELLFVMNNLNCGGAEKALISLLETIDYSRYNVDLFLFKHEGLFLRNIPAQVNLLEEQFEYSFFDMPIKTAIKGCCEKGRFDIAISRVRAGYIFKTEKNKARCEQRVWKHISKSLPAIKKKYDVAIGFLEKNPIYFCLDKVVAKKKIGFVHTDYDKLGMDPEIDLGYFANLDNIVTVSEECANILKRTFPLYRKKIEVMFNIVSPLMIKKLSLESLNLNYRGFKLVSVGRLNFVKGFDIAIEACKTLVTNGYRFTWLVIGDGEERDNLERMIENYGLTEVFILLGAKENPYPFIRDADVYIQPSRFEGKSIAIDEAKILQKPILLTNFSTAKDQIQNEENGLIVNMDSKSISSGIKRLIADVELRNKFSSNLGREQLGTESEINKLYELIEGV